MEKFKPVIRPIISLMFTCGVLYLTFVDKLPIEAFIGIATTVIIWWYKSRDEEKASRIIR